jgi:hypothetical protein
LINEITQHESCIDFSAAGETAERTNQQERRRDLESCRASLFGVACDEEAIAKGDKRPHDRRRGMSRSTVSEPATFGLSGVRLLGPIVIACRHRKH